MSEALSASLEDYLEAIYHTVAKKGAARAKDIASRLDVKASSVTGALQSLAARGLVNYAPYDIVTLTEKGRGAAEDVVHRHEALREFLVKVLGVEAGEADEAACRMEHAVSKPILERLVRLSEFVDICPCGGPQWVAGSGYHCDHEAAQ